MFALWTASERKTWIDYCTNNGKQQQSEKQNFYSINPVQWWLRLFCYSQLCATLTVHLTFFLPQLPPHRHSSILNTLCATDKCDDDDDAVSNVRGKRDELFLVIDIENGTNCHRFDEFSVFLLLDGLVFSLFAPALGSRELFEANVNFLHDMLKQLYCRFDSHQQWSEIVCVREVEKDDKSIAMICFFLLLYGLPCPYYDVSLSYLFSVSVTRQSHVKSVESLLTFHVLHSHCVSHCSVNRTFFSPFLRKKCEKGQCEFRSTCVRDARKRCEWPSPHTRLTKWSKTKISRS